LGRRIIHIKIDGGFKPQRFVEATWLEANFRISNEGCFER
jgi:hypothetical protein